jgi:hypothetical protein
MKRLSWGGILLTLLTSTSACGPGLNKTPTEPVSTCSNLAGTYKLSHGNSCGQFGNDIDAALTQTGCALSGTLSGIGTFTGTLVGSSADISLQFAGACSGTGSGKLRVSGAAISGTYSGTQAGTRCCSTVAGFFTLSR